MREKRKTEVKVKVTQSCLTLCDPMGYTVRGILQARILEWGAFPFSRGSSQPKERKKGRKRKGRRKENRGREKEREMKTERERESEREKRRRGLFYLLHLLVKVSSKVSSVPLNNGHTIELPGKGF